MTDDTELTPAEKMRTHLPSEAQLEVIRAIETACGPHLQQACSLWLAKCKHTGMPAHIATASLSMTICTNMARLLTFSAGIGPDDMDVDVLHSIGDATHAFLTRAVDAYIRKLNAEIDRQN
jgi:hypothetical protein